MRKFSEYEIFWVYSNTLIQGSFMPHSVHQAFSGVQDLAGICQKNKFYFIMETFFFKFSCRKETGSV